MQGMGLFPYKTMRRGQEEIIQDISDALSKGRHMINYFPPGVGKTSAVLTSVLEYSKQSGKRIFFLTNRRHKHKATVEILRKIGLRMQGLKAVDLPGRNFRCPNAEEMGASKLNSSGCICPALGRCKAANFELSVYRNVKNNILTFQETVDLCISKNICPVEMALNAAQEADVIVCDHRYIFTEEGEWFIESSRLNYKDSILVVDEAHRLPDNLKFSQNITLTPDLLDGAVFEADERKQKNLSYYLSGLKAILFALQDEVKEDNEAQIDREVLLKSLKSLLAGRNYGRLTLEEFLESLQILDASLRGRKGLTNTSRVLRFLKQWAHPLGPQVGVLHTGDSPWLRLNCLDPGIISKDIFSQVHSALLMSSTPIPAEMYIDILGIPRSKLINRSYEDFSPRHTRTLLSDKNITTSNQQRTPDMYSAIADEVAAISTKVPGNLAVFFPSRIVLESTLEFLERRGTKKPLFVESRDLNYSTHKKVEEGLEERSQSGGGILLGVQGGYFSDSPEFKRNLFNGVVVVGIPFAKPDLEQRATMEYMKSRFGGMKGYYYSQIYPAMSKVVQAMAGGPREEKGVCVLMDYRFKDPKFLKALPPEYQVDVEPNVTSRLEEIFESGADFDESWRNGFDP